VEERALIEKDVGRTFPRVFKASHIDVVRNVLQCYAVRFQRRNNAVGCVSRAAAAAAGTVMVLLLLLVL
jgi:hypothetical protein